MFKSGCISKLNNFNVWYCFFAVGGRWCEDWHNVSQHEVGLSGNACLFVSSHLRISNCKYFAYSHPLFTCQQGVTLMLTALHNLFCFPHPISYFYSLVLSMNLNFWGEIKIGENYEKIYITNSLLDLDVWLSVLVCYWRSEYLYMVYHPLYKAALP